VLLSILVGARFQELERPFYFFFTAYCECAFLAMLCMMLWAFATSDRRHADTRRLARRFGVVVRIGSADGAPSAVRTSFGDRLFCGFDHEFCWALVLGIASFVVLTTSFVGH
jgi:hypothetical protein